MLGLRVDDDLGASASRLDGRAHVLDILGGDAFALSAVKAEHGGPEVYHHHDRRGARIGSCLQSTVPGHPGFELRECSQQSQVAPPPQQKPVTPRRAMSA